jgi:hypothetical protein
MARRTWHFLFVALAAWSAVPTVASSQENRYTNIPFNGDPATVLRQRLIQAQRLDELLRQAHKLGGLLQKKLEKGGIDLGLMPKMDQPNVDLTKLNEELKKAVYQMKLDGKVPPEIKKGLEDFKEKAEQYKSALQAPQKAEEQPKAPAQAVDGAGAESFQDRMSRWALEMLKDAEDTKVGGMIQKSPAWKNAIEDLRDFITNPKMDNKSWGLGMDKLSLPEGLDAAFSKTWERMRAMEMPSLPKIDLAAPELGVGQSLSRLPVPRSWPIDQNIWWVGVAACVGLILWQFWKRGSARRSATASRRLGPWPVQPHRISSAADLIAAFEYLAVLRLGLHVRTWHHRAVAAELGRENDDRRRAAGELAALYEQARYSSAEASLSLDAVAAARRDVCFLAEMGFP